MQICRNFFSCVKIHRLGDFGTEIAAHKRCASVAEVAK